MALTGTIYALCEPDSQQVRYCGKTVKPLSYRMSAHRRDVVRQSHRHLYRWLKQIYDAGQQPDVIVCEQLELDGIDRNEQLRLLNEAERRWIAQFKTLGFKLTNGTEGGDGCHGRVVSQESRDKASVSNTGKRRSPEACENIKAAALQRPLSGYLRGESHPHYGKTQNWSDPEARAVKLRGENNPNASLTEKRVLAIFADDDGSYPEIARRHNTSAKVVCDIKSGKSWVKTTGYDPAIHPRRPPGPKPRLNNNNHVSIRYNL